MSQKSDKSPPTKGIFKGFTSWEDIREKRKSFKEKKQKILSSETRKRGGKEALVGLMWHYVK